MRCSPATAASNSAHSSGSWRPTAVVNRASTAFQLILKPLVLHTYIATPLQSTTSLFDQEWTPRQRKRHLFKVGKLGKEAAARCQRVTTASCASAL